MSVLLSAGMQDAATRQGFATSFILTGWAEIAGPSIAEISSPVRITYCANGGAATLVLKVLGSRTQEVRMMVPRLIERINASQGYKAVDAIRITQVGRSAGEFECEGSRPVLRRQPDAKELSSLKSSVEDVEDDELRSTLFELGESVLSRSV